MGLLLLGEGGGFPCDQLVFSLLCIDVAVRDWLGLSLAVIGS